MPKSGKRSIRSGLKKEKGQSQASPSMRLANAAGSSTSTTPSWKRPPSAMFRPLTKDYYASLLTTLG